MSPETCRADLKRLINEKDVASRCLFTSLALFFVPRFSFNLYFNKNTMTVHIPTPQFHVGMTNTLVSC